MIEPVNLKNDYMGGGICHNGSHFDRGPAKKSL